ncbi:MAG TPA: UDP-N-acetylmuramate dehydrogenase, partial [Jiangellaceae bacterium]
MALLRQDVRLADLTTLRLGGPAARFVNATTTDELINTVRDCDERGEPVLVLCGGSNVVVADQGFDGTVVRVGIRGVEVDDVGCATDDLSACGGVVVTAAAGEMWDDFVAMAVTEGWVGIEALSGIPGAVGATPMQNVGAYGQEVAETIWMVRTYDRATGTVRTFANADCGFGYRTSRFKGDDRFVVLAVSYQLMQGELAGLVRYAEVANELGIGVGERALARDVREAVLAVRRRKGMVLDQSDHDTWSAGSFFTNPTIDASRAATLPNRVPRWPLPDGQVKTSAAWLIEQAGFPRGYPGPGGRVALSGKHSLALTNRGSATTADLLALAREVRDGV